LSCIDLIKGIASDVTAYLIFKMISIIFRLAHTKNFRSSETVFGRVFRQTVVYEWTQHFIGMQM